MDFLVRFFPCLGETIGFPLELGSLCALVTLFIASFFTSSGTALGLMYISSLFDLRFFQAVDLFLAEDLSLVFLYSPFISSFVTRSVLI